MTVQAIAVKTDRATAVVVGRGSRGAPGPDTADALASLANDGAQYVGTDDGRSLDTRLKETPRRLSYGRQDILRTDREAVAVLDTLHEEIVGFAGSEVANVTGGAGYDHIYVNDPSLSSSGLYSLGRALKRHEQLTGAAIWISPEWDFDLTMFTRIIMSEGRNNLTIYAPARNATINFDRLNGAFLLQNENILLNGLNFRSSAGPINGTAIGEDESRARSIIHAHSNIADRIAIDRGDFDHPSWHAFDVSRANAPDGAQCRFTIQRSVIRRAIQGHLIGINNNVLAPANYTNNSSPREVYGTFWRNAYLYCLQRLPRAMGAAYVDVAGCYAVLAPYMSEYIDLWDGSTTYPDVHTDAFAVGVLDGGWARVRGSLITSAHADVDGGYATRLQTGVSGTSGRISWEGSAAENGLIVETNEAGLIDALPYSLPVDNVPVAGPLREAWVRDLLADVGGKADSASGGLMRWVAGSTKIPDGLNVTADLANRRTDRTGFFERVDAKREGNASSQDAAELLDYMPEATNRILGKIEGRSTGAVINATTLDVSSLTSGNLQVTTGTGSGGILEDVIGVNGEVGGGLGLKLWGSTNEPITIKPQRVISSITANATTDRLTITAHGKSGNGFQVRITSSGTVPAPLDSNARYFGSRVDANTIQVHETEQDAIDGTNPIDLTSAGTGTLTATLGSFNIPYAVVLGSDQSTVNFILGESRLRFRLDGGPAPQSGTYTPTLAATLNCSALSHSGTAKWSRNGANVAVAGTVVGTATGAGIARVDMSQPAAAPSTFTLASDAHGACGNSNATTHGAGACIAIAPNLLRLEFYCAAAGSFVLGYHLIYEAK